MADLALFEPHEAESILGAEFDHTRRAREALELNDVGRRKPAQGRFESRSAIASRRFRRAIGSERRRDLVEKLAALGGPRKGTEGGQSGASPASAKPG